MGETSSSEFHELVESVCSLGILQYNSYKLYFKGFCKSAQIDMVNINDYHMI